MCIHLTEHAVNAEIDVDYNGNNEISDASIYLRIRTSQTPLVEAL